MQKGSYQLLLQVETRIDCPLTSLQTLWYRRLLLKDSQLLLDVEREAAKGGQVWCLASWIHQAPECLLN